MNQGQQQFYKFIICYVKPEKEEEAKELLKECFKRQSEGRFSNEYLHEITPKILETLKEEKRVEVKAIMDKFGTQHVSK
jgi:uncharacterized protein YozE (UPF0346 family)